MSTPPIPHVRAACSKAIRVIRSLRRRAWGVAALLPSAFFGGEVWAQKPQERFPDFGFLVSPGQYQGPVFQLSQNYPPAKPDAAKLPAFFGKLPKAPFTNDFKLWRDYMLAVRDYCFEGNTDIDFRVEKNKTRAWFHIPWQHYGDSGREGIHGLTKEAPVQPGQLAPGQGQPNATDHYQTYAVGFFNDFGGYTIGQVWKDHFKPDASATTGPNGGFLEGTVIFKLLFVDVPPAQVPSLANPTQWQGYIQATFENPKRSIRPVSLIQMDIAIRDNRAPQGWFFGTFQYNGQLNKAYKWENLIPLGIMWGNDPTVTDDTYTNPKPTVTKINPNIKESAINPDPNELPPTHLGWNGRLNGPVDNPRSSCLSCHMTAEVPTLSPLSPLFQANPPPVGSPAWMRWFQNTPACGQPFDKEAKSADFSLQLSIGIANFEAGYVELGGLYASAYAPPPPPANVAAEAARPPKAPAKRPKVFKIERDVLPGETSE